MSGVNAVLEKHPTPRSFSPNLEFFRSTAQLFRDSRAQAQLESFGLGLTRGLAKTRLHRVGRHGVVFMQCIMGGGVAFLSGE